MNVLEKVPGWPWERIEGEKHYVAEHSDFGDMAQPYICPNCNEDLTTFEPKRDPRENEITHWEAACECGFHFTMYND